MGLAGNFHQQNISTAFDKGAWDPRGGRGAVTTDRQEGRGAERGASWESRRRPRWRKAQAEKRISESERGSLSGGGKHPAARRQPHNLHRHLLTLIDFIRKRNARCKN